MSMELAINEAQAVAQQAVAQLRARMVQAMGNVGMPADQKRCHAWEEYGWPAQITFEMLFNLYSRQSLANGAVGKAVDNCWRTHPWLIEGKDNATAVKRWEVASEQVTTDAFWRAFKEADRKRLVGRYSALILQIADNKQWNQPAGGGRLRAMIPVWANKIKPGEIDMDQTSANYGKPKMWNWGNVSVHPSRVFILGDSSDDAIGYLDPGYNDFVNIEKLSGGSGESFLKNAARQMNINFDPQAKLSEIARMHNVPIERLQEIYNQATRAFNTGSDVALITQGATVTPMTATVPDVEKPYQASVNSISASIKMPSRILIGNQSGERSSTEDREEWNAACQGRRESELSFEIKELILKLMGLRLLETKTDFTVMWDDLTAPTQAVRLGNAKSLAEINKTQADAGYAMAFTDDEVREAAGYEPLKVKPPLPEGKDAPNVE